MNSIICSRFYHIFALGFIIFILDILNTSSYKLNKMEENILFLKDFHLLEIILAQMASAKKLNEIKIHIYI